MDDIELITAWERRINEIFAQEQLACLRGLPPAEEYDYNGINLLMRYHDVVHRCAVKHAGTFPAHTIETDLYMLSDEVLYYLAHAYLYRPFINNPLNDVQVIPGWDRPLYPNWQNMPAKRYDMHIDTVFEKLYGFWNRIATLINFFLPKQLKSHMVDFSRVMQEIPAEFHQNPGYVWLIQLKQNEYKEFNERRRTIVHHTTTSGDFTQQHLNSRTREQVEQLMLERLAIPDFLRDNMHLSIETFIHTLDLLKEMDTVYFHDVDVS